MNKPVNDTHPLHKFRFCPVCGSSDFAINNVKSKHCNACGFTYYFNPSAATVAVIIRDGKLLTVRRAKEPAKGTLDLPGGFCDLYETSEEGVIREVKEETGLDATIKTFLFTLPDTYLYSGFLVHTIDTFYLCETSPMADPHAMDDAAEAMWMPLSDIRPELFGLDSIRAGVRRLLSDDVIKKILNK